MLDRPRAHRYAVPAPLELREQQHAEEQFRSMAEVAATEALSARHSAEEHPLALRLSKLGGIIRSAMDSSIMVDEQ